MPRIRVAPTADGPKLRSSLPSKVAGLLYMYTSVACGFYYVYILTPTFGNDLWWPGYNVSGYQAFVVDVTNRALATARSGPLDLFGPNAIMAKSYTSLQPTTAVAQAYPWRVILDECTSVEYAVTNLRTISASWSTRMMSQYCWVDFKQQWELAHTTGRLARCRRRYATNGAVYFEAVMRNVVWDDFMATWGGPGDEFTVVIGLALMESAAGISWLNKTSVARDTTLIADEINYWGSYGITSFQLQWSNRRGPGITESMVITNALGIEQEVTLKNMAITTGPWSTEIMYWRLLNDLFILQTYNRSLVRQASNFYALNLSATQPPVDFEVHQGLCNPSGNCASQTGLVHSFIGPFLSIDMFYVRVPLPLIDFYNAYMKSLQTALAGNATLRAIYATVPQLVATPTPPAWALPNVTYFGGNPMCLRRKGTSYVQQSFSYSDACSGTPALGIPLATDAVLLALHLAPDVSATEVCGLQSSTAPCMKVLSMAQLIAAEVSAVDYALVASASMAIASANTEFIQFATTASQWQLLHQPLVDATARAWSFYGRVCLMDWITGVREVISFEGDVSSAAIMSTTYSAVQLTTSLGEASLKQATHIVIFFVMYTSVLLFGIAVIASVYAMASRFHFVGANLWYFNRVAGSVWLGRPLQCLRGITALCVMSTAPVSLVTVDGYSKLTLEPRTPFRSIIVAGEATWIVYVVNDLLLLIFPRDVTRTLAPISSLGVWLLTLCVDVAAPLSITATLDRQCYSTDMDYFLNCNSAVVAVGSPTRLGILVTIQAVGIFGAVGFTVGYYYFMGQRLQEPAHGCTPPLSVAGICTVFTTPIHDHSWLMDKVVCVLSGMLPVSKDCVHYIFDIKAWVLVPDTITYECAPAVAPVAMVRDTTQDTIEVAADAEAKRTRTSRLIVLLGLTYMVLSIVGSVSYISVSATDLANDIWWANFNITGTHVFLANWFNGQLYMASTLPRFSLASANISQIGSFASSIVFVQSPTNFGGSLQHTQLNKLAPIIAGFRRMDACNNAPWVFTQYCFVDFERRWSMAYSLARQKRCEVMTFNGAVYLEGMLRNLVWDDWQHCWGAAFDTAVGDELRRSQAGRDWLGALPSRLSLAAEIAYWEQQGIQNYVVQWQNYKLVGLISTYTVESAYGLVFPLTLYSVNGTYRFGQQSSLKAYWGLASDLFAIATNTSGIGGHSLVRSSPLFAYTNQTVGAVLATNGTLPQPLGGALSIIQNIVGPFGTIDMQFVPMPAAVTGYLLQLMNTIRASSLQTVAAEAAYTNLTVPDSMYPVPDIWLRSGWLSFGGSPLCSDIAISSGVTVSSGMINLLSSNRPCSTSRGYARIGPVTEYLLVGTILAQLTPMSNFVDVCRLDTASSSFCPADMLEAAEYVQTFLPAAAADTAGIRSTISAIQAQHVQLLQFMRRNASAPLTLESYELLASEDNFAYMAWMFLCDWVNGYREVVRFEGDMGAVTVLGDLLLPAQQGVRPFEIPTSGATYARAAVQYITVVVILVAGLTSLYIVTSRGHIEGRNMFSLGSVGGVVWIGRPLLFIRSITAIGILSTGTLELVFTGSISHLQVSETPWYLTLIAANELTWLAAVVNDLFIAYTREYNRYYNAVNIALVWLVAGCLSLVDPAHHVATIEPAAESCTVVEVDFQIVCQSISIEIGQTTRIAVLIAVVFSVKLFCYCVARWLVGRPPAAQAKSIVLYAGAKYLFRHQPWIHRDIYYLDRASAVLNGLVTVRHKDYLYVLDIKTWRVFAVYVHMWPVKLAKHVMEAIPLTNEVDRTASFLPIGTTIG
ncbi:hypothetical protein ACHHYP_13105 [Achlya hypogyna]|uniref:Transmembrane protein n=1 Tax=Achlya hypogyna TaxID=1202772 RepID=A0A1V9YFW6_ACHHY|nr:hypothetical protein ACHHYP_13105 [Achlya hypogyna]